MMLPMIPVVTVLGVLLVLMAIAAVFSRSLASSIILLSALSLFASLLFVLVAAPDVAITEAAIGSALTTVVFVLALHRVRASETDQDTAARHPADRSSIAARARTVAGDASTGTEETLVGTATQPGTEVHDA